MGFPRKVMTSHRLGDGLGDRWPVILAATALMKQWHVTWQWNIPEFSPSIMVSHGISLSVCRWFAHQNSTISHIFIHCHVWSFDYLRLVDRQRSDANSHAPRSSELQGTAPFGMIAWCWPHRHQLPAWSSKMESMDPLQVINMAFEHRPLYLTKQLSSGYPKIQWFVIIFLLLLLDPIGHSIFRPHLWFYHWFHHWTTALQARMSRRSWTNVALGCRCRWHMELSDTWGIFRWLKYVYMQQYAAWSWWYRVIYFAI